MQYTNRSTTSAAAERVWTVLIDIERWPERMSSYRSVERLDDGPLRQGSRTRVRQPGLSPAVFEVTDLRPGEEFTWASDLPGVRTEARHVIEPAADGGSQIVLSLEQTGLLAPVVSLLLGRRIRRYLTIEAAGLRSGAEDPS